MPAVAASPAPPGALRVLGLGDPVTDIVAVVSHDFLATLTDEPGGCLSVEGDAMAKLLAATEAAGYALQRRGGWDVGGSVRRGAPVRGVGASDDPRVRVKGKVPNALLNRKGLGMGATRARGEGGEGGETGIHVSVLYGCVTTAVLLEHNWRRGKSVAFCNTPGVVRCRRAFLTLCGACSGVHGPTSRHMKSLLGGGLSLKTYNTA
eukprot:328062-Chlamydomonas_euryale.AAC.3